MKSTKNILPLLYMRDWPLTHLQLWGVACFVIGTCCATLSAPDNVRDGLHCRVVRKETLRSKKTMKAVFLDIDGVLLPFGDPPLVEQLDEGTAVHTPMDAEEREDAATPHTGRFTERSLKALSLILSETGAQVVLSSTWRCAGGADAIIEEFRLFAARERERRGEEWACPLGVIADMGHFEFMTDPKMHSQRQWEIAAWIDEAQSDGMILESWCALDDEELVSIDPLCGGIIHIYLNTHICVYICMYHANKSKFDIGIYECTKIHTQSHTCVCVCLCA